MNQNVTVINNNISVNISDVNEGNDTMIGAPASEFLQKFQLYYIPILCILGILGNSLSVVVFYKTKLRKVSSSYYLATLAISDNFFLVCLFITWLTPLEYDIYNVQIVCEVSTYLSHLTSFLSVWLVLAFTVERFLAVVYPLHRQTVCSISHAKRAKYIIIILLLIGMFINFPVLLFVGISFAYGKDRCTLQNEWIDEAYIFNIFDCVVTYVIPVLAIAVLNGFISRHMWSMAKVRRRLTNQNSTGKEESLLKYKKRPTALSQYKITKMLLIVSTTCLCLSLPSYAMRIIALLLEGREHKFSRSTIETFINTQQYVQQMFNANFGINFILYCISGQNFRKAVKSLLFPRKFRRRNTSALDSRTQSTSASLMISKKRRAVNLENAESSVSTQIIAMKVF